jgi:hypothetical protein
MRLPDFDKLDLSKDVILIPLEEYARTGIKVGYNNIFKQLEIDDWDDEPEPIGQ